MKRKITLTAEEINFVTTHNGTMAKNEMAWQLGCSYTKINKNMRALGLVKPSIRRFGTNGFFDVDKFKATVKC